MGAPATRSLQPSRVCPLEKFPTSSASRDRRLDIAIGTASR